MTKSPLEEIKNFCFEVAEVKALNTSDPHECKAFMYLPLFLTATGEIACVSSLDDSEINEVARILRKPLKLVRRVDKSYLFHLIEYLYARFGLAFSSLELKEHEAKDDELEDLNNSHEWKILKELLQYQITNDISDLVFIPREKGVEVIAKRNYTEIARGSEFIPTSTYEKILNIIKVKCKLDFSSKSPALEGAFHLTFMQKKCSFRASFVRTVHGQVVTLRYLSKVALRSLQELCPFESQLDLIVQIAHKPSKIKFIAGPMGSGKTTLLYALLSELSTRGLVITIEDPPEVFLPNICQIPVKNDFDYPSALKAVLRHNPDHIALGELRDEKTLRLAYQASSIGHSIFATIHAYDSKCFEARIESLGLNFDELRINLGGVVFTRLYSKLCEKCKTNAFSPTNKLRYFESLGCEKCGFTGISGKILVFEVYLDSLNDLQGLSFKEQCERLVKKGLISPVNLKF